MMRTTRIQQIKTSIRRNKKTRTICMTFRLFRRKRFNVLCSFLFRLVVCIYYLGNLLRSTHTRSPFCKYTILCPSLRFSKLADTLTLFHCQPIQPTFRLLGENNAHVVRHHVYRMVQQRKGIISSGSSNF